MRRFRESAIALGLAAAAFVLAFVQRPGWASSDTKIDLHVDPGRLPRPTWPRCGRRSGSLGHVAGRPVRRLPVPDGPVLRRRSRARARAPGSCSGSGSGSLLALAAWGMVRLLDDLAGRPRGVAHARRRGAVRCSTRTSSCSRLARRSRCSATPRCRGCCSAARRGLRRAGAAGGGRPLFALIVTSTGGGVNAAVTALGAARRRCCSSLYERSPAACPWRAARAFGWRDRRLTLAASLWWIVPSSVQAGYGIDFLQFTEQPGTIWAPPACTESLAPDGLLDLLHRRRLYGAAAALLQRRRATLLFDHRSWRRHAARPGARARAASPGRGAGATARSSCCSSCSAPLVMDDRLPGGHAAAATARTSPTTTFSRRSSCAPPTRRRRWSRWGSRASAAWEPKPCGPGSKPASRPSGVRRAEAFQDVGARGAARPGRRRLAWAHVAAR